MSNTDYEPIQPGPKPSKRASQLLAEWDSIDWPLRALVTIYMIVGSCGGFYASYLLTKESDDVLTWAFVLLILDPLALFAGLSLLVIYGPRVWLVPALDRVVARAGLALILISAILVVSAVAAVVWMLREILNLG